MVPAANVAMAVLAVVVTLVPSSGPTGRAAPRAAAAVPAAPRAVVPDPVPAAAPRPPTARVREPVAAKPARKPKAKRRAVAPATSGSAVRVHPARPSQPPAGEPPGDDIPVAGGDADPVPAR
jgi:hypothetical protein